MEVEREAGHEIVCGGGALCLCLVGEVILLSNGPGAIRTALTVADLHAPPLTLPAGATEASDLLFLDASALASVLGHAASVEAGGRGADPKDVLREAEPVLALVRGLGTLVVALRPSGTRLVGEVQTL